MHAVAETISAFEWLGRELRAKTIQFEISIRSTGEHQPNWEDKAGVFAKMDDELQKDLAFLLAYGDFAEHTVQYRSILMFLMKSIYAVADNEKRRNKSKLPEICRKIANMELYFFLHHHLNDKFTGEGRLWFAGVDKLLSWDCYRMNWAHYGDACTLMLNEAKLDAWQHIEAYRHALYADA